MKTTLVHKKGRKRAFKEPSITLKSDQESENIVESKKNRKKAKIDNTIQNGSPVPKAKMQVLQKVNKQQKKQKKVKEQDDGNIRKLSKAKVKTNVAKETKQTAAESKEETLKKTKEKKLEHLKNKQLIREMNKTLPRKSLRYKAPQGPLDIEILMNKVNEIKSREVLSKTAKKRVATLLKKIRVAQAEKSNKSETVGEDDKKNKQQASISVKNKQQANVKGKRKAKREYAKNKVKISREGNNECAEDDSEKDESDIEEEEEEMNIVQKKVKKIKDEEDKDEEDNKEIAVVEKKKKKAANRSLDVLKKKETKDKQYVLFVSNLPHNITGKELKQHFLSKVDAVASVKIQTKPGIKKSHGFAYVELSNSADYEKALSLNHTFLKKKKINVQYMVPMNANKVDIIAKNKKLEVLCKTGKFADVKEKKKSSKKGKQKSKGSKA